MFEAIFHAWQTTWQVHPQLCSCRSAAGLTAGRRWWTWWTEVWKHNYGLADITKRAPGTNPSQALVVKNNQCWTSPRCHGHEEQIREIGIEKLKSQESDLIRSSPD